MSILSVFEVLRSTECENPECGKPKKRGQVFCPNCYFKLDPEDREALYSKDPDYFMEAVRTAIELLTC